ncbi:MAG: alpha/beta fold hydrolase, partial [Anaerolineae bacterium]|nr:alpha/beta fold hydrolase [Anaerolineae bacterium]
MLSILKRYRRSILIGVGVFVLIYAVFVPAMIFWPQEPLSAIGQQASDEDLIASGIRIEQVYAHEEVQFTMRDGTTLAARYFPGQSQQIILMLHGVTGNSRLFNEPAGMIRDATSASVYALDLRGHGESGGVRGSVDYVGQYEDDLADTITAIRSIHPDHELIVLGYSMGGAIALRYAAQNHEVVDRYVLVAPNLGQDAPTANTAETPETPPDMEPFFSLHIPRIIGLAMYEQIGIRVFSGLPTMFFNLPDPFVSTYSYSAMMNSTPADYRAAFEAIDQPLLIIVGSQDETMMADAFPAMLEDVAPDSEPRIVTGENHGSIRYSPALIEAIQAWLNTIPDVAT